MKHCPACKYVPKEFHKDLTCCPNCFIKFVPTKDDLTPSPCRVAERETGPPLSSNVQASAAEGNPVTLFLYIAADAQQLEPYKLTLPSELIIAAADEINQLREKLASAKREITCCIRKLENIYQQIDLKTL